MLLCMIFLIYLNIYSKLELQSDVLPFRPVVLVLESKFMKKEN